MEPWQGGWASWCVGSVFPAPQLLTGASALPLGPLLFDGIGKPHHLLSAGCPGQLLDNPTPNISEQTESFLSTPTDVFFPEALVEEHLQEDNALRKSVIAHSSQVLGNRLQVVKCRDGEYAAFFATGVNGDCIGSALCCWDKDMQWHVSSNRIDDPGSNQPPQDAWSTSPPLRHPILQLSAIRRSAWNADSDILIAARSTYRVQFLTARKEGTQVNFSYPMAACVEKYASHVAWNQHYQGEAAVVLETGEVRLFDLQRGWSSSPLDATGSYKVPKNCTSTTPLPVNPKKQVNKMARVAMKKKSVALRPIDTPPFEWWQCEFAWHPKTLLVAGPREVFLMDLRTKNSNAQPHLGSLPTSGDQTAQAVNASVVARIPGAGSAAGYCNRVGAKDTFLSFTRANYDGMYEFCTATKKHLFLFDTRRPQTSLLQWVHGMDHEPPGLLTMCPISAVSQQSSTPASDKGKAILAASFQSGNIHAFCYGGRPTASFPPQSSLASPTTPSHLDERLYAWQLPSKVFAPQATPNNWSAVLSSPMNIFQHEAGREAVMKRPREHMTGLVVLPKDVAGVRKGDPQDKGDVDGRGFTLMQLTGVGDILVQQYGAAEKLQNVGSQASPMSTCDADAPGLKSRGHRRRKNLVTKLPCFSNYIRTGSALCERDDSKILERNSDQLAIFLENRLSQSRHNSTPVSQFRVEKALSDAKEGHAGRGVGASDLLKLPKHVDQQKLKALVAETVQDLNVPLSVYEIAHKVLRRALPTDLARLAAGIPADASYPCNQKYVSMLLSDDLQQRILAKKGSPEVTERRNQVPAELTIPLPVLLQSCSLDAADTGKNPQENGNQEPTPRQEALTSGGDSVEPGSLTPGHEALQNGCDDVQRAIEHLMEEGSSREHLPVLSLADPVESWRDTPADGAGPDGLRVLQFHIPTKPTAVKKVHDKPVLGPPIKGFQPLAKGPIDRIGTAKHGDINPEAAEADAGSQVSVLERDAFCTFVGGVAGRSDSRPSVLDDSDICPIKLPFVAESKEVQPEETAALNSLGVQFKQWQQSFVPYQTFFRDSFPRR